MSADARLASLRERRAFHLQLGRDLKAETLRAIAEASEDGMSGPEIATALGVSHQRIYRLMEEARKR